MKDFNAITWLLITAYSPYFNHIPSVRTEKLAKYLSRSCQCILIGGMPKVMPNSNFRRKCIDIGKSEVIELEGVPLSRRFDAERSDDGHGGSTFWTARFANFIKKSKRYWGPLAQIIAPISSGGAIWYRKRSWGRLVESIVEKERNNMLVMFTTYNPWFPHQIAFKLKKKYKEKVFWVADFRDPPFCSVNEPMTNASFFRWYTKRLLGYADLITVINEETYNLFLDSGISSDRLLLLRNGFDLDDFSNNSSLSKLQVMGSDCLEICYTGRFYEGTTRDINPFCDALFEIKTRSPDLFKKIKFSYAGSDANYVARRMMDKKVEDCLNNIGFVRRDEAIEYQKRADLLLLVSYTGDYDAVGAGFVTGKVFEYMANDKPILVIGSRNWELREDIEADKVSKVYRCSETHEIASYIIEMLEHKVTGRVSKISEIRKGIINKYSYSCLSETLIAKTLDKINCSPESQYKGVEK